jgi:hypothetical protein
MPALPATSAPSLADAANRYKRAADAILAAYDALERVPPAPVTPHQLDAGVRQFLRAAQQLESGQAGALTPEEVSRAGDYGMTLLRDLVLWAQQLGLSETERELDAVALDVAEWIAAHAGELRTLAPVVDALANRANREHDGTVLERLTLLARRLIRATAPAARTGLDPARPSHAWRMLNLNYGIIATRTRNPALIEGAYDELVRNLPGDAAGFFAEGMQQMERFDYPREVRALMARYFDRWTRPRMH